MSRLSLSLSVALTLAFSTSAFAGSVEFKDPRGDDNGPGSYVYPTGAEYKKGSFDLTGMTIREKGANVEITIEIATSFADPWDSKKWPEPGHGFSLQMFQLYIDADGKVGSGETETLPGMNATFDKKNAYEYVVIISPQGNKTIQAEVKRKAGKLGKRVVLPKSVEVRGREVTATVKKSDLKGFKAAKAGYQLLSASNEGYPKGRDILSRKVNEFEGEHRFGGGADDDSDPHFVDVFAGKAKGGDDEAAAQHKMLKFKAGAKSSVVLTMVRP